ncbi:OLC1v1012689C1 [Oldenlandia corymbosa var. corymbosa]|uniref:OLC1v1012689C1 n=1 Tax=Oldenlandia corymbosa var. corymbosa TaxID=529605 RepID=A0AAV1DWH7_OLDCO|nr:OLC1v1012689C1 [Oldenlandia corymbosa var. corymbosa]
MSATALLLPAPTSRHHRFVSSPPAYRPLDCGVTPNDTGILEWKIPVTGSPDQYVENTGTTENKTLKKRSVERRIKEKTEWIISISPYDTAWVALVEDINGGDAGPQFPASLEWIANNQLSDGSWGDGKI